jgi:hypothetical protein
MKIFSRLLLTFFAFPLVAQNASSTGADPWKAVAFLEGTWFTSTTTEGSSHGHVTGTYTFRRELANHVLVRHTIDIESCKGPASFDCDHGDLLYIYQDTPGQPLRAIYFDNEGHVIHYDVSTPDSTTAIFLSDRSQPGPQYRLIYELKGATMSGKFQMHMPGQQSDWKSYLEWTGERRIQH